MDDLRCDAKRHAILISDKRQIEVKCNSRFCGAQRGVIVLHRFDIDSGELVETNKFSEPARKE